MVYLGVQASGEDQQYLTTHMDPGWPIHTTTVGTVAGNRNISRSDFSFFTAAALVEIMCIILIAPTYWGWWRFGRPFSFSPLEIAKVSTTRPFLKATA